MLDETLAEFELPTGQKDWTPLTQDESRLIGQIFKRDRLLAEILAVCKSAKHLNQPENILVWFDRIGQTQITELWQEKESDRA
jgi:hypothetical protein